MLWLGKIAKSLFIFLFLLDLLVITKSWQLKDYSRWVFRKNSMEFFAGFDYLLILLYKWLCSTITRSHVLPECSMITWPYHVIWLLNSHAIYIFAFVDVGDQMFKCAGNSFLSGALITLLLRKEYEKILYHKCHISHSDMIGSHMMSVGK